MSWKERDAILEEQHNLRCALFSANREWSEDKDDLLFDETLVAEFANYIWKWL
jgi:hypothetical protein